MQANTAVTAPGFTLRALSTLHQFFKVLRCPLTLFPFGCRAASRS